VRKESSTASLEIPILVFWAGLTLSYGSFLGWRWLAMGQAPGLQSVAGVCSVAAMWLYLPVSRAWRAPALGRPRARGIEVMLLLVLGAAILASATATMLAFVGARPYPLVSAVASVGLVGVLRHVLRQILSRAPPERAESLH
jgi:hypothetical protein